MKQSKNKKTVAFTLAEVLITLAIIGVVASMTIPSLKANLDKKQNQIAFKKVYAEISSAGKKIIHDKGGTLMGLYAHTTEFFDDLNNYAEYSKRCLGGKAEGNCWHKDEQWYMKNGDAATIANGNQGVILKSGILIYGLNRTADCSIASPVNACMQLIVDTNGFKKPNKVSNDIYMIYFTKNQVLPAGIPNDIYPCNNSAGWGCSAYVLAGKDY